VRRVLCSEFPDVQPASITLYSPWLVRWAALLALLGLIGSLLRGASFSDWLRFALLEAVIIPIWLAVTWLGTARKTREATSGRNQESGIRNQESEIENVPEIQNPKSKIQNPTVAWLRQAGWLLLALLFVVVLYAATSEDLETVMVRNTAERAVMQFWRGALGDERWATRPTGAIVGVVQDGDTDKPIEGAAVVVADVGGVAYSAYTDKDGRYRIEGVPMGNYLPMAVAPAYEEGASLRWGGRVATVRPGETFEDVDFRLEPDPALPVSLSDGLEIGPPRDAHVDNPEPSDAIRREFSFKNDGMTLGGGLIHEPPAEMGSGPFPILLIIYPGKADGWEGVSIPLAAKGYVVVSYFPVRLTDLNGDMDDLMLLLDSVSQGRLSRRGDKNSITLVGGSISTAYTYLMAREAEGDPVRENLKAAVQYGGLFDFFKYRNDWEHGEITIDPGISELEYLLVALGRPDTRPELYLHLSPRYALGSNTMPPTLLVHTDKDIIVPVEQSHIAADKLNDLNTPNKLITYPNLQHYLDTSKRDPAQVDMLEQTVNFLGQNTRK